MKFRWILALSLTGLSAFAGRAFGNAASQDADGLRLLMDDLQLLRTLTLERLQPMGNALMEMKSRSLLLTGELMRADGTLSPERAWRRSTESESRLNDTVKEEIAALFASVEALGRKEHDLRYAQTIARLGKWEEELRSAGREKTKLYVSLGALIGLAVGILLL